MDPHYGGNIQNEILKEEHDHTNRAKRVAVVAGNATVTPVGLATIYPSDFSVNGNLTTTGSVTLSALPGTGTVMVQTSGTWAATLEFEATVDGTNWFPASGFYYPQGDGPTSNYIQTVTDVTGQYIFSNPGFLQFRVRCSAHTSGTIVVYIRATQSSTAIMRLNNFGIFDTNAAGSAAVLLQQEGSGSFGLKVTHYSNVTLNPSLNFIGLTTAVNGQAWPDPKGFVGLTTSVLGNLEQTINSAIPAKALLTGMSDGTNIQAVRSATGDGVSPWLILETAVAGYNGSSIDRIPGDATNGLRAYLRGNVTLSDPKGYIGLVSLSDQTYTYAFVSQASIQVKNGAGVVSGIIVGSQSLPTLTLFDATSATGTIINRFGPNPPVGSNILNANVRFGTGLTITTLPGVLPNYTVIYN